MREWLKKSLNLISVRIVQELVRPYDVAKKAKSYNLTTRIVAVDAIALGVSDVIPLEITSAYASIANDGIYNFPTSISHIEDQHGRVIKYFSPEQEEVADASLNYIMLDMMRDVIDSGTGSKIRWKYKFNGPLAGKTGTTNGMTDAWFIGFTPQIAIGVWVGVDDPSISLGKNQYGSVAALPIFGNSIKEIYELGSFKSGSETVYLDNKLNWEIPSEVVEVKICKDTFSKASKFCKDSMTEIYLNSHSPSVFCQEHNNPMSRFKNKWERDLLKSVNIIWLRKENNIDNLDYV